MNCADRLVALFGTQAEVARQFRLDRAVVNNWVKSGYVPARWAMEVENASQGQITAAEVLNEATARKPLRMKSRPDDDSLFGSSLTGNDNMNAVRASQTHQLLPSAAAHADGARARPRSIRACSRP